MSDYEIDIWASDSEAKKWKRKHDARKIAEQKKRNRKQDRLLNAEKYTQEAKQKRREIEAKNRAYARKTKIAMHQKLMKIKESNRVRFLSNHSVAVVADDKEAAFNAALGVCLNYSHKSK